MNAPTPILIDRDLMRTLRTHDDYAMIFGERHADALKKLIDKARASGQEVFVACLRNGTNETIVARVPRASGEWVCVR